MLGKDVHCPFCDTITQSHTIRNALVNECPQCGSKGVGIAKIGYFTLDPTLYSRFQEAMHSDQAQIGHKCPSCGRDMQALDTEHSPLQHPLEVCPVCQWAWGRFPELVDLPPPPLEIPEAPEPPRHLSEEVLVSMMRETDKNIPHWRSYSNLNDLAWWKYVLAFLGVPVETEEEDTGTFAWVTWGLALILIAAYIFLNQDRSLGFGRGYPGMWFDWFGYGFSSTLFTSFFAHGGVMQLIVNVYFLMIMGDNVENTLGTLRMLLLLAGAHATGFILYSLWFPHSVAFLAGAGGAVAGVMAAYLMLFPHNKLGLPLFWLGGWWWWWLCDYEYFIEIPAWVYLFFWMAIQTVLLAVRPGQDIFISILDQIGGFIFGLIMIWVYRMISRPRTQE